MNQVATIARDPGDIMESVMIKGDLAKLTPQERSDYYAAVCRSVGLNPLTQPFAYITLNGKLTLYALRGCTDQLRAIYKVSVVELAETDRDGVYIVTAKVQNGEGRTDMAKGAVTLGSLKGDALANAIMKCETKAKRRATLSICGLGMLDETEIETIPSAARKPAATAVEIVAPEPASDPETGEIGPRLLPLPQNGEHVNWIAFGQALIAGVKSAASREEIERWISLNSDNIMQMERRAPRAYKSVNAAYTAALDNWPLTDEWKETPRLPAKDSQALRRALIQKLAKCETVKQLDQWKIDTAEGFASLQDEDQAGVREFEVQRRDQMAEVAEVVS